MHRKSWVSDALAVIEAAYESGAIHYQRTEDGNLVVVRELISEIRQELGLPERPYIKGGRIQGEE